MGALVIITVGTLLGTLAAIYARKALRRYFRRLGFNWWGWL